MILAIETSCDETAASIVKKDGATITVLSSVVSSQIAIHAPFGGVVPALAAREHVRNIVPVVESALREASASRDTLDAIAVTAGPGLMPALQIGVIGAKTLSYFWNKPLIPIHHIEGHIYANFINHDHGKDVFPLLALVVSGGHTQLVFMRSHFSYEILGETHDDAVGEAFDKVAKMLGLPYPGGPEIARRAQQHFEHTLSQSETSHETYSNIKNSASQQSPSHREHTTIPTFPRPMIHSHDYHFSFSGLKTSVLYFLKKHATETTNEAFTNAVCAEFQNATIDVLIEKTRRALHEYTPKTFIIAGGVSTNTELRKRMNTLVTQDFPETHFLMPSLAYSLDNAAMIGAAACLRWEHSSPKAKHLALSQWKTLEANPNLTLNKYTFNKKT